MAQPALCWRRGLLSALNRVRGSLVRSGIVAAGLVGTMAGIMVRMTVEYTGGLHCSALHGPSKSELATDAPLDNRGRGEAFSPTDLASTALATCMLTTMAMRADDAGISIDGATATVDKIMTAEPPRRIAKLVVHVHLPIPRSADTTNVLEPAGRGCPVGLSLHPDVVQEITFHWKDEA